MTEVLHDRGLELEDQIGAALGFLIIHMLHLRGGGPFLGGEGEDADALDTGLLEKFAQLIKFGLSLAGEPRDQTRAQHQTGDALAQRFEEPADVRARAAAVHALEDRIVDVLDGDVQILDDFGIVRDLVDELLVKLVHIQIVKPQPLDALDLRELPAQLGQTAFPIEIGAVAGDVLGDDDELLHPMRG